MYHLNVNYFTDIHTEAQSYILGYFYARASGRLQLNKNAAPILYVIRKELCCDAPIHFYNNIAALNLTGQTFKEHLIAAGCRRTRTENSHLPSITCLRHFLRAIYENYGRLYIVKQKYINVSLNYNECFINELREFLNKELNILGHHLYRYEYINSLTLLINSHDSSVNFLNYIYGDFDKKYCQVKKFEKREKLVKKVYKNIENTIY